MYLCLYYLYCNVLYCRLGQKLSGWHLTYMCLYLFLCLYLYLVFVFVLCICVFVLYRRSGPGVRVKSSRAGTSHPATLKALFDHFTLRSSHACNPNLHSCFIITVCILQNFHFFSAIAFKSLAKMKAKVVVVGKMVHR